MARRGTTNKPKSADTIYQKKLLTQKRKREFAEVRLSTKELNRIEGGFPLYAKAAFEDMYIEGEKASYRIYIKTAELALKLEHIEDTDDSVPYWRQSETAVVMTKENDRRENKKGFGAKVAVALGMSQAKVSANAGINKSHAHSEQETLSNKRKVDIVSPLANNKWAIGHEHYGDPDQDGGFLRGVYVEYDKPLCSLRIPSGKKAAKVVATLSVRKSQMHVEKEQNYASFSSISKSFESDFDDHLMKKLVELRLMGTKSLKETSPTRSLILAHDSLELEPVTEDDL